jgi:hypothetical protein
LREVGEADEAGGEFLDADVVLGDVEVVLDDAAGRGFAAGTAAELDGAGGVLELLSLALVAYLKL